LVWDATDKHKLAWICPLEYAQNLEVDRQQTLAFIATLWRKGRLVVVESTPQQDYARIAWLWTPCFRGITYVHRAVLGVAAPLPI